MPIRRLAVAALVNLFVVLTAASVALLATEAVAGISETSADELKCLAQTSKALGKLFGAEHKCVAKCWRNARAGNVPATDCSPPYGGTTAACIHDSSEGAEAKALANALARCSPDCPECYLYAAASCDLEVAGRVGALSASFDEFASVVWCDDSGSADGLTAVEAKCQDVAGKALAKSFQGALKCQDKCVARVAKHPEAPSTCAFGRDDALNGCTNQIFHKASSKINATCIPDPPECHPGNGFALSAIVENLADTSSAYCGICEANTGGACWFLGELGASCDDTCASQRLAYSPATASYAGSEGTLAQCTEVLGELGLFQDPEASSGSCEVGVGCGYLPNFFGAQFRCITPATIGAAHHADVRRACACE